MKFSTKLLLLYLGFTLGVTTPICFFLYYAGTHTTQKQIEKNLQERVVHIMDKIDLLLFERFADIQVLAAEPVIRSYKNSTPTSLTQHLLDYREHYKIYSSLSFFDANQVRIADTAGLFLGKQAQNQRWTEDVFDKGIVSAGADIHFAEDLKRRVMFFAAPVKDEIGQIIGAVVARIPVEKIYSILGELVRENEEVHIGIVLFDKEGYLLYSNYDQQTLLENKVQVMLEKSFETNSITPLSTVLDKENFYTIAREQGYLDFKGNQWTLIAHYPIHEAFADVEVLRNQAIAVGLGLLFIAMIGVLVFARKIIRPVIALTNATVTLGEGDFNAVVAVSSQDEIGQLAVAFNQMTNLLDYSVTELKNAKRAAVVANQAKSEFLANMSHELRTPLNGILGYAQILCCGNISKKQREGLSIIKQSGDYLLILINDVLDLSKIEAGKLEIDPTEFHFGQFIQGVTDLFQMRAQQKGIVFVYKSLSPLPVGVYADEKRLRQILLNLLGNAVKFTERGKVSLTISYGEQKALFQVEDTGIGITPEDVDKIFLPFQQVGDKNYRAEGTGLGLPITKKLVELMGGKLEVESILGQGSIFWTMLDLPEVSGLEQPEPTKTPLIIGFQNASCFSLSYKILVIDDEEINRAVLVNMLLPLGFEVIEATNGLEGIEKAHKYLPDAILVDLRMSGMDGIETTGKIRHSSELKDIVIIATSASVFEQHRQECLVAGCNDFLTKPIQINELLEQLRRHLKLEWVYEKNDSLDSEKPLQTSQPLIGPSPEQAAILFDLATMGNIGGIFEEIDKLEQSDPQLIPFVNQVRQLAEEFEKEQICDLVEPYLKKCF